jgi:HSP20 family molecular chaperone IbpA
MALMVEKRADPKDVADMLEALARRMRSDPVFSRDSLALPTATTVETDDKPTLGALDVFTDERNVTVTVETRNADASHVHVSLLDGRLLIGLGEGPRASRRDLPLPTAVDEEGAMATFRNGVLDVVLPIKRR